MSEAGWLETRRQLLLVERGVKAFRDFGRNPGRNLVRECDQGAQPWIQTSDGAERRKIMMLDPAQADRFNAQSRQAAPLKVAATRSMKAFIGLDVSLASSAICVLDEHGDILKEAQVASEPDAFVDYLRSLPRPIEAIGLEAGPLSQWLHRGLAEDGPFVVLFEQQRAIGIG